MKIKKKKPTLLLSGCGELGAFLSGVQVVVGGAVANVVCSGHVLCPVDGLVALSARLWHVIGKGRFLCCGDVPKLPAESARCAICCGALKIPVSIPLIILVRINFSILNQMTRYVLWSRPCRRTQLRWPIWANIFSAQHPLGMLCGRIDNFR